MGEEKHYCYLWNYNVMYFFKINELDDERLICILSIIGIMLFVMLFEARTIYIYILHAILFWRLWEVRFLV